MFFEPFPTVDYNVDGNIHRDMVNIVIANMLKRRQVDKKYAFRTYKNTTKKSIEQVSHELYGEGRYWWTILVANDYITPYMLTFHNKITREYCKEMFGDNRVYDIHHYFNNLTNRIVDDLDHRKYLNGLELPYYIKPITNFEYVQMTLTVMDEMYYINPSFIETFIEEYRNEIKGID